MLFKHISPLRIGVIIALFLQMAVPSFAQRTVSGTVTDENGEPLIAAGVMLQGTIKGTVTDIDGRYVLSGVPSDGILEFSAIGYKTQAVPVEGRSAIDVRLSTDALFLDDAVVIGYGTQRKGDITSAVASVKSEDFLTGNIGDAAQLIKGKVAGLNVTKGNGDPTASSTIMLRGVTSLMGGYTPLILVDGIEGSLETVAPESIEEISVLKDASAAAIYGTRGASGVIIITTKTGKRGEHHSVSYSGYASASDFSKRVDFMDSEFMHYLGSLGTNKAGKTYLSIYSPFSDLGYETDWLDETTRIGFAHNHNVALEGGTDNLAYSANVTYRDNQGVFIGSYSNDLRAQMDVTQYMFNDVLKLNFNMLKSLSKSDNQDNYTIYHQSVIRNPTSPIYTESGDYYEQHAPLYYYNPIPYNKEHFGGYRSEMTRLTANVTVEPVSGWQTNLQLSTRRNNGLNEYYNTGKYQGNRWGGINGSAGKSQSDFTENLLELTSQYDKQLGKSRFSVMGGYSWMRDISSGFGASNSEFPTDAYLYNKLQAGKFAELQETDSGSSVLKTYAGVSSWKSESTLIGFFGRFTWNYDNRFNILATLRHEGSSKFGADHKWGTFPAVSAGWTMSNEDWLRDVKWLDNLKLRAGYGVTGVIPGSSYLSLLTYDYDTTYGNYISENGVWRPSLSPTQNANPDLKWEKTSEYNVGVDFGMFDGRLYGALDAYYKLTTDMLWDYTVPVPPNLYGSTTANVGSMSNRGIELMLGGVPVRTRDFEWSTTLTAAHNKNVLESLSNDLYQTEDYIDGAWTEEPTSMCLQRTYVGHSLGEFYMLKSVGLGEKTANKGMWMIENPETGEAESFVAGMRDVDSKYRQYLGSGLPLVTLGWSNNFRFKGFDLALAFSSQLGYKIFNCQRMFYENLNIGLNRYKSAVLPVYGGRLSASQEPVAVSYYLEDGDYLKLDNATLGYTFNTSKSNYLEKARIYISGENLFCLTKYQGIDPEMSNDDRFGFGVDYRNKYPTIRTLTVGLNLTFGAGKQARSAETFASAADLEALAAAKNALAACNANGEKLADELAAKTRALNEAESKLAAAERRLAEAETAAKAAEYFESPIVAFFEIGKYVLSNSEKERVKMAAKDILANGGKVKFTLSGNADKGTGTPTRNEFLARERANTVMNLMHEMGVDTDNFSINYGVEDIFDTPELNRCVIIEKQ